MLVKRGGATTTQRLCPEAERKTLIVACEIQAVWKKDEKDNNGRIVEAWFGRQVMLVTFFRTHVRRTGRQSRNYFCCRLRQRREIVSDT